MVMTSLYPGGSWRAEPSPRPTGGSWKDLPSRGAPGAGFPGMRNPDTIAGLQRLLALLQGEGAPEEPPKFETPYWQDIESLKWLSELYMANPGLRSNYLGNLMAYGMGGVSEVPFGSALPGGAINLPKLFITPPSEEPVSLPNVPKKTGESYGMHDLRRNTAMQQWLASGQSPYDMQTVYPRRARVNPLSIRPKFGGNDDDSRRN